MNIHMGNQTLKGVKQIQPMNPFIIQQAETTAATQGCHNEKHTHQRDIEDLLREYKIHSVLVTDEDGKLLGVVDSFSTMI